METLLTGIEIVFFGLIMFSLIVFVHELGHFVAARAFGVRVSEFMIGLPGPNIGFTFKGTKFGVTPILLGGYALIAGMEGGKENPNLVHALAWLARQGSADTAAVQNAEKELGFDLEEALDILHGWGSIVRVRLKGGLYRYDMPDEKGAVEPDSSKSLVSSYALGEPRPLPDPTAALDVERRKTYRGLGWFKRVLILANGVIFNLLFAIIVFTTVLMVVGDQQPITTLDAVAADSPAALAGIEAGDTLVGVDGTPIDNWEGFTAVIATHQPGEEVRVTVERDGHERSFPVVLGQSEGRAILGVTASLERVPISFTTAAGTAVGFIGIVAQAILQLFNPATFSDVVSQSSSVIGISVEARNAAEQGFIPFIILAAALSISIGLMNLLPIPPLDGGKIVVETIERVTRRHIPVRIISGISVTCFVLLIALFLFVTNQDIHRYILGG
ncbi:MAG: M50 family metallopeptidase [Coriobacteriales bacterium]|jgi:regulator of sigma E protease|nr:M50 family metallopeptidase [Coriobacteriales bacterium]